MIVIKSLKKMAGLNDKRERLGEKIRQEMINVDPDGLEIESAYLVSGCKEKDGHLYQDGGRLDNGGLIDDTYYCCQHVGYCGDDYYGTLYFKTDVPGQFVAVPFQM